MTTATASNGAENGDPDEDIPDVDPSHEQLNLPPNSITLWRIIPKLTYASQVRCFIFFLLIIEFNSKNV